MGEQNNSYRHIGPYVGVSNYTKTYTTTSSVSDGLSRTDYLTSSYVAYTSSYTRQSITSSELITEEVPGSEKLNLSVAWTSNGYLTYAGGGWPKFNTDCREGSSLRASMITDVSNFKSSNLQNSTYTRTIFVNDSFKVTSTRNTISADNISYISTRSQRTDWYIDAYGNITKSTVWGVSSRTYSDFLQFTLYGFSSSTNYMSTVLASSSYRTFYSNYIMQSYVSNGTSMTPDIINRWTYSKGTNGNYTYSHDEDIRYNVSRQSTASWVTGSTMINPLRQQMTLCWTPPEISTIGTSYHTIESSVYTSSVYSVTTLGYVGVSSSSCSDRSELPVSKCCAVVEDTKKVVNKIYVGDTDNKAQMIYRTNKWLLALHRNEGENRKLAVSDIEDGVNWTNIGSSYDALAEELWTSIFGLYIVYVNGYYYAIHPYVDRPDETHPNFSSCTLYVDKIDPDPSHTNSAPERHYYHFYHDGEFDYKSAYFTGYAFNFMKIEPTNDAFTNSFKLCVYGKIWDSSQQTYEAHWLVHCVYINFSSDWIDFSDEPDPFSDEFRYIYASQYRYPTQGYNTVSVEDYSRTHKFELRNMNLNYFSGSSQSNKSGLTQFKSDTNPEWQDFIYRNSSDNRFQARSVFQIESGLGTTSRWKYYGSYDNIDYQAKYGIFNISNQSSASSSVPAGYKVYIIVENNSESPSVMQFNYHYDLSDVNTSGCAGVLCNRSITTSPPSCPPTVLMSDSTYSGYNLAVFGIRGGSRYIYKFDDTQFKVAASSGIVNLPNKCLIYSNRYNGGLYYIDNTFESAVVLNEVPAGAFKLIVKPCDWYN